MPRLSRLVGPDWDGRGKGRHSPPDPTAIEGCTLSLEAINGRYNSLDRFKPGEAVKVVYLRAGKRVSARVELVNLY